MVAPGTPISNSPRQFTHQILTAHPAPLPEGLPLSPVSPQVAFSDHSSPQRVLQAPPPSFPSHGPLGHGPEHHGPLASTGGYPPHEVRNPPRPRLSAPSNTLSSTRTRGAAREVRADCCSCLLSLVQGKSFPLAMVYMAGTSLPRIHLLASWRVEKCPRWVFNVN